MVIEGLLLFSDIDFPHVPYWRTETKNLKQSDHFKLHLRLDVSCTITLVKQKKYVQAILVITDYAVCSAVYTASSESIYAHMPHNAAPSYPSTL